MSLVLEQEYTKAEASPRLGINPNLIARWIQEHQADELGQAFHGNAKLMPELKEIRALRAQVKRLQMEKDILKKRSSLPKKRNNVLVYYSEQEDLACRRDMSAFGRYRWRLLSPLKQGR